MTEGFDWVILLALVLFVLLVGHMVFEWYMDDRRAEEDALHEQNRPDWAEFNKPAYLRRR